MSTNLLRNWAAVPRGKGEGRRGVVVLHPTPFDDGVWRMWRDAAGFDQRFSATLGRDSFEGLFELATTPGVWKDDLRVTYRRVD